MPIKKIYPYKSKEYHTLHSWIRRKLTKEAFETVHKCQVCGVHKDLQIHIPNPDPKLKNQPGFFIILCKRHHAEITP